MLQVQIDGIPGLDIINTNLVGEYNLPNILLAVAVAKYFAVPNETIKAALENYLPSNSRSQMVEKDGNKIILDAYNANPSSMKAAIENFSKMDGTDKVLFLGGMKELGIESTREHYALINLIKKYTWKNVVLVGDEFNNTAHGFVSFQDSTEAGKWFKNQHFKNALILIKGSRSTEMEKVLD